jgi:hypothetical protein
VRVPSNQHFGHFREALDAHLRPVTADDRTGFAGSEIWLKSATGSEEPRPGDQIIRVEHWQDADCGRLLGVGGCGAPILNEQNRPDWLPTRHKRWRRRRTRLPDPFSMSEFQGRQGRQQVSRGRGEEGQTEPSIRATARRLSTEDAVSDPPSRSGRVGDATGLRECRRARAFVGAERAAERSAGEGIAFRLTHLSRAAPMNLVATHSERNRRPAVDRACPPGASR